MATKLLAEKNGNISIVTIEGRRSDTSSTSYIVLRHVGEKPRKYFFKEQGKVWELFLHVDDATKWIQEQNKPPAVVRRIAEGSREWKRREKEILAAYAVPIISCSNCGSPRHKQYTCAYCCKE